MDPSNSPSSVPRFELSNIPKLIQRLLPSDAPPDLTLISTYLDPPTDTSNYLSSVTEETTE